MLMVSKAEQKERTHETILESASRLLRERGIAGARVAEVMKGAGLTVGGFYAHFASKDALVRDAIRRTGVQMRERLFRRLEDKPDADRAEVILKRYLSAAHRDEGGSGCPLPAVAGEIGTTAPEHAEILGELVDSMAAGIELHLAVRPEASRRHLALGLVALMVGGLSLARALRGTPLSDEVLRACRSLGRLATRTDGD
jgi:TetR/AcrR family transcriptional repressor of nem operon